ncbi:MAG: hypothetical protein WBK88_04535 [Methanothrix sp.]
MPPLSPQDELLLDILRSVVPDIVRYLDDAGFFDLGPDVGPLDILEREGFWPRVARKLRGANLGEAALRGATLGGVRIEGTIGMEAP